MQENKANFSVDLDDPRAILLPRSLSRHVTQLLEASPTSKFICRQDKTTTNYAIYIIEHNESESYTLCHIFLYDFIGDDYSYQSINYEQINIAAQFFSELETSHF